MTTAVQASIEAVARAERPFDDIIRAARALTPQQREALHHAWIHHTHGRHLAQINAAHRIGQALTEQECDEQYAARAHAWHVANQPDPWWAAAPAVSDAAFVALCAELMTEDEQRLFDTPWRAVVDNQTPRSNAA